MARVPSLASMIRRVLLTCALFAATLGASASNPTVFAAPAQERQAGVTTGFSAVLPSGRIISPAGKSVVVGMNSLGVALTPDGKFAIVTNDDERQLTAHNKLDPRITGGFSLAVVDTKTMRVVDFKPAEPGQAFFIGIAALRDPKNPKRTIVLASDGPTNAVRVFDLSQAGKLSQEDLEIPIPGPIDEHFASLNHGFPAGITLSKDGKHAYVADNLANTVSAIDIAKRRLLTTSAVGFFPYGVAVSGRNLYVTDEGLMNYAVLPQPGTVPPFGTPVADPQKASALSIVALNAGGDLARKTPSGFVAMDPPVDGDQSVGGAHPSAIVTSADGRYAYVTMSNVDRIATVDLTGTPRVVGGLQLRLFDRAPYGTQPNALALSHDGRLLYVALAGINAVAVLDARDPAHLHRLGLIPTGWYPSGLALSHDGRYLYVSNAKGYGEDRNFHGDPGTGVLLSDLDSNTIWATLQRIDLHRLPLGRTTMSALRYLRTPIMPQGNTIVPPLRSQSSSAKIKHVVFILEENKTYDSMLGDLTDAQGKPYGEGDPALVSFGANVTPNLHALAREFGLAVNEYADAEESDAGHQFAAAGIASDYTEKTLLVKGGRRPQVNKNEDPEDYPRAGYIFNSLAHANLSYRDYGDLIRVSGYDEGSDENPKADDPNFAGVNDQKAPTQGLGGLYSLDVPAPAVLSNHVDLNYPGWNLRIRDVRRAQEFIRDYSALVKANNVPAFTYIWLPADHGGRGPNIPPVPEEVADGDRALGMIVDYLSHLRTWDSTAIFIMPDDAQSSRDHVSEHRSYAVVVSPYARRHYLGRNHLSTVSILKTEEELLGLPPLSLGELLATDMSDFFTETADLHPFVKLPVPAQTASVEGERIADLLLRTDQSGPDADVHRSAELIALSRQADRLAAARTITDPAMYAREQNELYAAALRVVKE